MDRKGFTLVELIATIFIISVVLGIASYSVISVINNSRKKSEKVFVDQIYVALKEYVSLYGSKLKRNIDGTSYTFEKCGAACSDVEAYEVYYDNEYVKLNILLDENLIDVDKLINPVNNLDCLDGVSPDVRIFKDSDYVYYYYVDLRGDNTSCEISDENGIINTLPDNLKSEVGLE